MPRAASARRASGGKNDGVATGMSPSLFGMGCVYGESFSLETAALADACALTLPAIRRTRTHGHSGSVGKHQSE